MRATARFEQGKSLSFVRRESHSVSVRKGAKVVISGHRAINLVCYNYIAAKFFLKLAKAQEDGQFYSCMAANVFAAFTFEAYLNTVGSGLIRFWSELEYLSPESKLACVTEQLGISLDAGRRPLQTIKPLVQFRNDIAHGKPATVNAKGITVYVERFRDVSEAMAARWEKLCVPAAAERNIQDVYALAEILHGTGRLKPTLTTIFGSLGHASYSRTPT